MDPLEELTKSLASSDFEVSKSSPCDPNKPHPRFSQYKNKSRSSDQDGRRKQLLEHQKSRRTDALNIARALVTGDIENESDGDEETSIESMDTNVVKEYYHKRLRVRKSYKKQLMLSEWLVHVPDDLFTKWTMVAVPEGKRALIVSGQGTTKHFSRGGSFINQFPSHLPGGCRKQRTWRQSQALLDTIYVESARTYYVLDIIAWNDLAFYDCDTMFRFHWLNRKVLDENPQCLQRSKVNPYIFKPLKQYSTDKERLTAELADPNFPHFEENLDGLLFYHNMLHYMPGHTPLVGWLKGYMVPEILGIPVSGKIESQKPIDYVTMNQHITEFETNYFHVKEKRKLREKEMESPPTNKSCDTKCDL